MGLKKGQTGNPKGRPKGTPNKVTASIKDTIREIIEDNVEQLKADIAGLEPVERIKVITSLLPYSIPKAEPESKSTDTNALVIFDRQPIKL
jgi:hypothetical protein